jgi:hypothetical protein
VTRTATMSLSRLERCMDTLCRIMADETPENAERLVPVYLRLEKEIRDRSTAMSALEAARHRAARRTECASPIS